MAELLDELLTADPYESAKKAEELRKLYNEIRVSLKKRTQPQKEAECRPASSGSV